MLLYLELDAVDACAIENEELVEEVASEAQVGDAGDSDEPQGSALVVEHCQMVITPHFCLLDRLHHASNE